MSQETFPPAGGPGGKPSPAATGPTVEVSYPPPAPVAPFPSEPPKRTPWWRNGLVLLGILAALVVGDIWLFREWADPDSGEWRSGGMSGLGISSNEADHDPLDSPELAKESFAVVRAVLAGKKVDDKDHPRLSAFEGRRAFVSVHGPRHPAPTATGKGGTLFDSVEEAARRLRDSRDGGRIKEDLQEGSFRAKVEFPRTARKRKYERQKEADGKEKLLSPSRDTIGLRGFYVEAGGEPAWLTPTEVVETDAWFTKENVKEKGFQPSLLKKRLEARAGVKDMPAEVNYMDFDSVAWVEGVDPAADAPVKLYRGRPEPSLSPAEPTPDQLLASAIAAADYIERIIGPNGKQVYLYRPDDNKESPSYNQLRHAGTTFALAQAYDRTKWPRYRAAVERSIGYIFENSRWEKKKGPWGDDFFYVVEAKDAKLGGGGLALIALAQYTTATGDMRYLNEMRGYARFIRFLQQPNGRMSSIYEHTLGEDKPDEENIYYPGEALLGLMRLYQFDPNPMWLETAKKAADYMILDRDKSKTEKDIPHDHWLMYGLSYLYHATHEVRYRDHSYKIARAIQTKHRGPDHAEVHKFPDYLGGFYRPPSVTPGACRIEGLSATIDLAREAGDDHRWMLDIGRTALGFNMRMQFLPLNAYWTADPRRALGGFPESAVNSDIRNDYVQHTLSALLGIERQMRADENVILPGGPLWWDKVRAGAGFDGLPERKAFEWAGAQAPPPPAASAAPAAATPPGAGQADAAPPGQATAAPATP